MPKLKNDAKPSLSPSRDAEVQDKLETLRKEYTDLHNKKITTEANIQHLEKNLDKLRATAEKEYGTSDLAKLRELLETRRRENEEKVAQYEQHVKEIKEKLAAIEEPPSEGA